MSTPTRTAVGAAAAGGPQRDRSCYPPFPVDLVYTWVNGSDPQLEADLERFKDQRVAPEVLLPGNTPTPWPSGVPVFHATPRPSDGPAGGNGTAPAASSSSSSLPHHRPLPSYRPRASSVPTSTNTSTNTSAANVSLAANGTAGLTQRGGRGAWRTGGGSLGLFGGEPEEEKKAAEPEDTASASRFRDNQELRYSLRSVERYAPWIRHIYIVTNGQVPVWLNLSHPRITVVPHEDIFPNRAHLPTFSSPAIEANIHRIKGLSERFLYLNDDVMFGNDVFVEDFFTEAAGQKVYLSWAVPNCNDGCPSSWLGDGYCDTRCNVSACHFDKGDCRNGTANLRENSWGRWGGGGGGGGAGHWNAGSNSYWGNNNNNNFNNRRGAGRLCSPGCPDSWIHDKFCDQACKNPECAFDATDCGIDIIKERVPGRDVTWDTRELMLPRDPVSLYLNLSTILGTDHQIGDASHDNPDWVRTASISKQFMVMVITFHRNVTLSDQNVAITISTVSEDLAASSSKREITFNLTVNASSPSVVDTPAMTSVGDEKAVRSAIAGLFSRTQEHLTRSASSSSSNSSSSSSNSNSTTRRLLGLESRDGSGALRRHAHLRGQLRSPLAEPRTRGSRERVQIPVERPTPSDEDDEDDDGDRGRSSAWMDGPEYLSPYDLLTGVTPNRSPLVFSGQAGHEPQRRRGPSFHSHLLDGVDYPDGEEEEESGGSFDDALGVFGGPPRPARHRGRRLLDSFGDSLRHVNMLLDEEFGMDSRKVPAHMPHFIDRRIMEEMQARWGSYFNATSSHRFRAPDDMQYAFSYFYYLMSKPVPFSLQEYFAEIDRDGDGLLNRNEMRTLATQLRHGDRTGTALDEVAANMTAILSNGTGRVTVDSLANNTKLLKDIKDLQKRKKVHRFELKELDEVSFLQVRDDANGVLKHLDSIRRQRPKFICLNDNMNASHPNPRVVDALHDIYRWLFPNMSSFELPDGAHNAFTSLWERDKLAREGGHRQGGDRDDDDNEPRHHPGKLAIAGIVALVLALWLWTIRARISESDQRKAGHLYLDKDATV